jgi:hypothetical protein
MKNRTKYQEEKANALNALRFHARTIKQLCPTDRPGQRQFINDCADTLQKDLPYNLEDWQRERIGIALSNLACKLHPKG